MALPGAHLRGMLQKQNKKRETKQRASLPPNCLSGKQAHLPERPSVAHHAIVRTRTVWVFILTNDQLVLLGKVVRWNLEVKRCRAFPDAAGNVVVRAVARAEPTAIVTSLADGNATQVSANT